MFREATRPSERGERHCPSGNSFRRRADWNAVLQRILSFVAAVIVLVALVPTGAAVAQEANDDDEVAEPASYGDAELIDALTTYGLLDEWLGASPVSHQASLLAVTSGNYQAQRQDFLSALDTWAARTELVRRDLDRLDDAQGHVDLIRSSTTLVRDSLGSDDRLRGPESDTLKVIEASLETLASLDIPEPLPGLFSDGPITQAEIDLADLRDRATGELQALNGPEAAIERSGVGAFVGFDGYQVDLAEVEQLIGRGRDLVGPAQRESERLVASALAEIPNLHAARMLGSTDVAGLSVVTVDAYVRAAARVSCSVDWALLAGIGRIESNHGRLDGAWVSGSGQVSTTILGPLLDGGASERTTEDAVEAAVETGALAAQRALFDSARSLTPFASSLATGERGSRATDEAVADAEPGEQGNGFAVVVDTDNGRLDGNDQWDRAIGPMQFLPETWSRWATDGNGDGFADPDNLYDSALSAARFLCHLSETRGSSPSTFVLGYNESRSYVRSVLATAESLRATLLPSA